MKATAMISGFVVDSFKTGMGSNAVFGLGLRSMSAGATSLGMTVFVMGRAFLSSVSMYYVSYELESLNILGDKVILAGTASVGCSFRWGTLCQVGDSGIINTTYVTGGTTFSVYYSNTYFYGFSTFMSNYDGSSSYGMKFSVSGTIINGTSYQTGFNYYGNGDAIFSMTYSYLIIL